MLGGNFARKGLPTARMAVRGLRDNRAYRSPEDLIGGERLAHDTGSAAILGWKSYPPSASLSPKAGGEGRGSGTMVNQAVRVARWILFGVLAAMGAILGAMMIYALSTSAVWQSPQLRETYLEGYPVILAVIGGLAWVVKPKRR